MTDRGAYRIKEVRQMLGGIARSTVYERIKDGGLQSMKCGSATLILARSPLLVAIQPTAVPTFGSHMEAVGAGHQRTVPLTKKPRKPRGRPIIRTEADKGGH